MTDENVAAVERYTICIWKTTVRGEESVLWYSGTFSVTLDSQPERLVITVMRRRKHGHDLLAHRHFW
jgi:hypothetical protein